MPNYRLRYHKFLLGKTFIVTTKQSYIPYQEYKFEFSSFIYQSCISYMKNNNQEQSYDYDYDEVFKLIKKGSWKIISDRHLILEKIL